VKPAPFSHVEEMLREMLKTKVQVTFKKNKGKVIIEFYSREDLERLLSALAVSSE
jgi:ParB family chromosome partitioning protein